MNHSQSLLLDVINSAVSSSTPSTSSLIEGINFAESNASTEVKNGSESCVEVYDYYKSTEKWLLGVVALPFIVMGLMANCLSIRIFSHKYMRKQRVNWYLLILGGSDSVILLSAFFVLTLPRLGEILAYWNALAISYYSSPFLFSPMNMAQTISVWMTVAMSLHRFIGVCFPYQSSTVLTTRNVKMLIVGVILFAILFNSTRFFEVYYEVCLMVPINVELPVLRVTALRQNSLYRSIVHEWAYTLIMFTIPFTILIIVNSMVIVAIHRSRKVHARLNLQDDGARKHELAKEISTSIMLVAIVLAFLLCNTLAFIVNLMERLTGDADGPLHDLYVQLVPWSNMLVMTNASINICIYCIFSDRYRQLMFYYLHFCGIGKKCNNNFNTLTMSTY